MSRVILGVILGLLIWPVAVLCYLRYGHPPVAVGDAPFPYEAQIVSVPLNNRIDREQAKTVPIDATPDNLLAGAKVYFMNCAGCHGSLSQTSEMAKHLYPGAPQLWKQHRGSSVVGVSDDPAGVTYWKVSNGIRLTGMPAFNGLLTPTEMWQVSVLLANADKPLPQPVKDVLSKP